MPLLDASGRPTPPAALTWNHSEHDYNRDEDGFYVEQHPVDAFVDLALTVPLGSLPCAPDVGHELGGIEPIGPRRDAKARAAVRKALARIIKSGDITLGEIVVDGTSEGLLYVAPSYVNNRTGTERTAVARTR
jgi:hypothetical protein